MQFTVRIDERHDVGYPSYLTDETFTLDADGARNAVRKALAVSGRGDLRITHWDGDCCQVGPRRLGLVATVSVA